MSDDRVPTLLLRYNPGAPQHMSQQNFFSSYRPNCKAHEKARNPLKRRLAAHFLSLAHRKESMIDITSPPVKLMGELKLRGAPLRRVATNKVTFAPNEAQVRTFQIPQNIPYEDLWFTPEDFDDIKSKSRSDAREWRKLGYGSLLKDTFEDPRPDAEHYIAVFCALDGTLNRRGLERHCSRKHGEERSDCKDRARHCVLSTQHQLRQEQNTRGAKLSESEISLSIAKAYNSVSREPKIFARRIAIADEFVALEKVAEQSVLDQHLAILSSCRPKMQRRLSNYSAASTVSMASIGSSRIIPHSMGMGYGLSLDSTPRRPPSNKKSPGSSTTLTEELYAAMA
jgi:hypothetical protein